GVIDSAAGVVVIAGRVGERPSVAAVVAGVGVGSTGQGQAAQRLAEHAGGRAGNDVRGTVVSDTVGGDDDVGIGLGDGIGDRPGGVVVVAGGVGEGPGVSTVGTGVGVRGAGEGQTTESLAEHAGSRPCGRVGGAVVGDAVGGHDDVGVGLGDGVADRTRGVV